MNYGEYIALFSDARGDMAYVSDIDTYEMLFMTRAAMAAVGLKSETEYAGKKCYRIMQGKDQPCEFCCNCQLLDGKSPYTWEQYNPVAKKWVRLECYLFMIDGRRCRGEWATDISSDRDMIESLQNQLEKEKVLKQCIRTLALEHDANIAVNKFLQYVGNFHQADRACIFEIEYGRGIVKNTYEWCAPGVQSRMQESQALPIEFISDWLNDKSGAMKLRDAENSGNRGLRSTLSAREVDDIMLAPIRKDDITVGFLGVDNARAYRADESLISVSAAFITEEFQKRQLIWDLDGRKYTDRLTGFPNRNRYTIVLDEYHKNPPSSLAVFFMDINGLKDLNEHDGHDAGDGLICQLADILREHNLRAFRIDGDEFVALQPGMDRDAALDEEKRLRSDFGRMQPYSVSMGMAWGDSGTDVLALVAEADERMFADKQIYYRMAVNQRRENRAGMASVVLNDIRSGAFVVYYQPQVDLKDGSIFGAEALVRKLDADGALTSPDRFVPLYEAMGIISHMDFHVLEMVCRYLKMWREELGSAPNISVNFSRITLMETDVVERICAVCERYGVPASQLTIEVTESAGKLTHEQLNALVMELQASGFCVSLDDFGSRYSNLSILTSIDFQLIKLDKSLIDQIEHSAEDKGLRIVRNLIRMCRDTISTPVLAEGVENRGQVQALKEFSCDYAQGYYFSRPMPVSEFEELLRTGRKYDVD